MIGHAPNSPFTAVPGYIRDDESRVIMDLSRNANRIAHVGTEYGRSVSESCYANGNATVYAIDKFTLDHPYVGDLLSAFKTNTHFWQDQIVAVQGISWEVGKAWEYGPLDLIFIDAGHSYLSVSQDIAAWWPHLRGGGTMLFHDYGADLERLAGVKEAVDEFAEEHGLIITQLAYSLAAIVKPVSADDEPGTTEDEALISTADAMALLDISRYKFNQLELEPVTTDGRTNYYRLADVEAMKDE